MVTLLLLWLGMIWTVKSVRVMTRYGDVEGETLVLHNEKSINTFYSIPYAMPPLEELRFQNPREPDAWPGVFPATSLGSACIQDPLGLMFLTHPFWNDFNEDCLHLNIFAPANQTGGPYPVMVFIHGGAYQGSANVQYPGHFLASRDVVVVVPNYRLGIFGFITTGDDAARGNFGTQDQILALRFVQENIAAFGGDPAQVTIFGQSAGAASCGILLISPAAAGLFHQAILESGSDLHVWAVAHPNSQPENYTKIVAEQLNCTTENSFEMIDCLRTKDARDLHAARFNCSDGYLCLGMQPVVDGPGGVIPDLPLNLRLSGQYNHATLMSGFTKEDASPVIAAVAPPGSLENGLNRSDFESAVRIISDYVGYQSEDLYQAVTWFYTQWPFKNDPYRNREEFIMMATDAAFAASADYQAKLHTAEDTTYMFIYSYRSAMWNNYSITPEWLGTFHTLDVPYVFGLPLMQLNPAVRNQTQIVDIIKYNELDIEYADFTLDLWTNFARFGNPTREPVQAPGNNPPVTWDEYKTDQYNFLDIDDIITNVRDYRQQEFAFWSGYIPAILGANTPLPPYPRQDTKISSHEYYDAMCDPIIKQAIENLHGENEEQFSNN